jgi:hypothetical protein
MSAPSLNGPDSPPVLYNPSTAGTFEDVEDERCQACHATALYTDWPQGDRVCTNCGLVAQGHIVDTGPEWKDFNEADDLVKGLPSGARSGLVAVDESKYIGGLQPTTLSKHSFGGESHGGFGTARIRKRLRATNRKLDHMMETIHTKALSEAKLDRRIRLKRGRDHVDEDTSSSSIRPEMDSLVLHEEEEAHRMHTALYAEKWSLDRSIMLFGLAHEQSHVSDDEREDLQNTLDSTTRKASQDLYTAYSMLKQATEALQLPDRVMVEASHRLVRFVTRKDGFRIPGLASRLSKDSVGTLQEQKEAVKQHSEYTARKQMAALGAALLFLTARSLGWTRSLHEISSAFASHSVNDVGDKDSNGQIAPFIKGKHVSRAMKEIQSTFPEYFRHSSSSSDPTSSGASQNAATVANFVEHALRKLQLPPVAEASICTLLIHMREEQLKSGDLGGVKLPTLCAGIAYLVCNAGSAMQRLAQQHERSLQSSNQPQRSHAMSVDNGPAESDPICKKNESQETNITNHSTSISKVPPISVGKGANSDEDDGISSELKTDDDDAPFDVFSHAAILEDPSEKDAYELKRMWDAWAEQISWARSGIELEQSCGVSRNVILDFYRAELYPRRADLLKSLADAVQMPRSGEKDPRSLHETPLAPILMSHFGTAASVMNAR